MQLSGRTVLVTGGASGLGRAAVEMIAAQNGRAVILDLDETAGAAVASQHGGAVKFVRTDVTSESEVAAAVDDTGGQTDWFADSDAEVGGGGEDLREETGVRATAGLAIGGFSGTLRGYDGEDRDAAG